MSLDEDKLSEYYNEVGFDLDPPGDDDEYVQCTVDTQVGIPVQILEMATASPPATPPTSPITDDGADDVDQSASTLASTIQVTNVETPSTSAPSVSAASLSTTTTPAPITTVSNPPTSSAPAPNASVQSTINADMSQLCTGFQALSPRRVSTIVPFTFAAATPPAASASTISAPPTTTVAFTTPTFVTPSTVTPLPAVPVFPTPAFPSPFSTKTNKKARSKFSKQPIKRVKQEVQSGPRDFILPKSRLPPHSQSKNDSAGGAGDDVGMPDVFQEAITSSAIEVAVEAGLNGSQSDQEMSQSTEMAVDSNTNSTDPQVNNSAMVVYRPDNLALATQPVALNEACANNLQAHNPDYNASSEVTIAVESQALEACQPISESSGEFSPPLGADKDAVALEEAVFNSFCTQLKRYLEERGERVLHMQVAEFQIVHSSIATLAAALVEAQVNIQGGATTTLKEALQEIAQSSEAAINSMTINHKSTLHCIEMLSADIARGQSQIKTEVELSKVELTKAIQDTKVELIKEAQQNTIALTKVVQENKAELTMEAQKDGATMTKVVREAQVDITKEVRESKAELKKEVQESQVEVKKTLYRSQNGVIEKLDANQNALNEQYQQSLIKQVNLGRGQSKIVNRQETMMMTQDVMLASQNNMVLSQANMMANQNNMMANQKCLNDGQVRTEAEIAVISAQLNNLTIAVKALVSGSQGDMTNTTPQSLPGQLERSKTTQPGRVKVTISMLNGDTIDSHAHERYPLDLPVQKIQHVSDVIKYINFSYSQPKQQIPGHQVRLFELKRIKKDGGETIPCGRSWNVWTKDLLDCKHEVVDHVEIHMVFKLGELVDVEEENAGPLPKKRKRNDGNADDQADTFPAGGRNVFTAKGW